MADAIGDGGGRQTKQNLSAAGKEQPAAGKEGNAGADRKQADRAQYEADEHRRHAAHKHKRQHRNDGPGREEQERGDGCLPGRAAQFFGIDAQFLARERIECIFLVADNTLRQFKGLRLFDPARLVDQRQLLGLFLGVGLDLGALDGNLLLVQFASFAPTATRRAPSNRLQPAARPAR